MSMLLWYGDGDDDAISLGDSIGVWQNFKEICAAIDGDDGFEELESVPGFGEQMVTPWWLSQVKEQAQLCLTEYGEKVSESARAVLETLAAVEVPAEAET